MSTFEERLTQLRLEANLKQSDLADILKVSKYTISGWERGIRRPEFGTLNQICGVFNVSLAYLLGENDDSTPPGVPTDADFAQWAEDDEIASMQSVARMLTRLSPKSYRIAASTIRSAYMIDKEDDTLGIGYDVKVSRYEMAEDETADEHTDKESRDDAVQDGKNRELTTASTDGTITAGIQSDSNGVSVSTGGYNYTVKGSDLEVKKASVKRRVRSQKKK
ncbi:MAG: helix-turn-helix transcriptional regulator [Clostridiales bacterium]|nr:helix-turn-helix transcriptional regulator [Clostridiales bacterium]